MSDTGPSPAVTDEVDDGRLVVAGESGDAELVYEVAHGRLLLLHTEVPESFRGQGVGARLVRAALAKAATEDLTVVPWCPYTRRWLQEHPDEAATVKIDFATPRPPQ